ncbi:hypothetical protein QYF36_001326 [Acer negundo]|nr:hypothetical protein QYF36_001326 [Acer negundo]
MLLKILFLLILLLERANSSSMVTSNKSNELVMIEKAYVNWVKMHASSKQPVFKNSKNKLKPCLTIKVSKNPRLGDFATLQKAINAVPAINLCRVVIIIGAGTYREKVEIPNTKAYMSLVGAGADKTIVEWDDTADRTGQSGRKLGTYASATFAVNSPYFIAKNITFKNNAPSPPSGSGWYDWGDKNREMTVFYGQYKCSGPGAEYGGRVPWSRELTQEEANPFISLDFIDGYRWLPRL